jgi:hypothetical protein
VKISDEPSTIVGVMPVGFHFPVGDPVYFWATFAADAEGPSPHTSEREGDRLSIIGRIKKSAGAKQALADLNAIQRSMAQQCYENTYRLGVFLLWSVSMSSDNASAACLLASPRFYNKASFMATYPTSGIMSKEPTSGPLRRKHVCPIGRYTFSCESKKCWVLSQHPYATLIRLMREYLARSRTYL